MNFSKKRRSTSLWELMLTITTHSIARALSESKNSVDQTGFIQVVPDDNYSVLTETLLKSKH